MVSSEADENSTPKVDVNDSSTSSECVDNFAHRSDRSTRTRGRGRKKISVVTTRRKTRSQARSSATESNVIVSDSDDVGRDNSRQRSASPGRSNGSSQLSRSPFENGVLSSASVRRSKRAAAALANAALTSDEKLDGHLKKLLNQARNVQETNEILQKWRDPGSRRSLLQLQNIVESSSSSEPIIKQRRNSKKNYNGSSDQSSHELSSGSENESLQSVESDDVRTTRRKNRSRLGNSLRKTRQGPQSKSVPLPKISSIKERIRNRAKNFASSPALQPPSKPRKRKAATNISRNRKRKRPGRPSRNHVREVEDDDGDEIIDEGNGAISSEAEIHFTVGEDEEEVQSEKFAEEEGSPSKEEASDEDEDDDDVEAFLKSEKEESTSEEEDETEEEVYEQPKKRLRSSRPVKTNQRRKRTDPSNVFTERNDELSAKEQKERLDYLVSETARIASGLHQALAQSAIAKYGRAGNGSGDDADPSKSTSVLVKEESFVEPNGSGCELQQHQTEGVKWLLTLDSQGLNAILADEMGLGKTIQAVAFLASLVISGSRGPHLIIAPKNVCDHWVQEIQRWYPGQLTVTTHLGPAEERLEKLETTLEEDNFDIMVTSFEIALRDLFSKKRLEGLPSSYNAARRRLRKVEFEYLVVDEAHRLKNDNSRMNQAIRLSNCARRRVLLTGTPLSNNLRELWSLMNILNPNIFSNKATFESWFSAPFDRAKGQKRATLTHAEKSVIVDRLHTIIRPFFRRRERKDVCPSYTSADEVVIHCPMSLLQKALMYHYQRRASEREAGVSNIVMAMREVSNHPFTSTDAFDEGDFDDFATPKLVALSGKFSFLHYALPRLIASGHRVLIFSQFRTVLDFLEELMDILNMKFGRLDGTTKTEDRVFGISEFNAPGSDIPVFLLTTRAGGVGLNLQSADTVILFDSDWNPSADLQAVSRIQRIGQKKTVHIMRLVSDDSIDALIVEVAEHKIKTQTVAVGAGKFHTSVGATQDQRIRQRDLEELLERLETKNFVEGIGDSPNVANGSVLPKHTLSAEQATRLAEWNVKLLRPGETSLSHVDVEPIWIDSTPDSGMAAVPKWLDKDADLVAASRAITCKDQGEALKVYEQVLTSRAEVGTLNKHDRAARACRNIVYISDADSEDHGVHNERKIESDGSVQLEDESSDSASLPDNVSDDDGLIERPRMASKIFNWTVNRTQDYRTDREMPKNVIVRNPEPCAVGDISSAHVIESSVSSEQFVPTTPTLKMSRADRGNKADSISHTIDEKDFHVVEPANESSSNKGNIHCTQQLSSAAAVSNSSPVVVIENQDKNIMKIPDLSDAAVNKSLSLKSSPEMTRGVIDNSKRSTEKVNPPPCVGNEVILPNKNQTTNITVQKWQPAESDVQTKAPWPPHQQADTLSAVQCPNPNSSRLGLLTHPSTAPVITNPCNPSNQPVKPAQDPSPPVTQVKYFDQQSASRLPHPLIESLNTSQARLVSKPLGNDLNAKAARRTIVLPLMKASGAVTYIELQVPYEGAPFKRAMKLSNDALEFAGKGDRMGVSERCSQLSKELKEWENMASNNARIGSNTSKNCTDPTISSSSKVPTPILTNQNTLHTPLSLGGNVRLPSQAPPLFTSERRAPMSASLPLNTSRGGYYAAPMLNSYTSSASNCNRTIHVPGQNRKLADTYCSMYMDSHHVSPFALNSTQFNNLGTTRRTFLHSPSNGLAKFELQRARSAAISPSGTGFYTPVATSEKSFQNCFVSNKAKEINDDIVGSKSSDSKTARNVLIGGIPSKPTQATVTLGFTSANLTPVVNQQAPAFTYKSSEPLAYQTLKQAVPLSSPSSSMLQGVTSPSGQSKSLYPVSVSQKQLATTPPKPSTEKPVANVLKFSKRIPDGLETSSVSKDQTRTPNDATTPFPSKIVSNVASLGQSIGNNSPLSIRPSEATLIEREVKKMSPHATTPSRTAVPSSPSLSSPGTPGMFRCPARKHVVSQFSADHRGPNSSLSSQRALPTKESSPESGNLTDSAQATMFQPSTTPISEVVKPGQTQSHGPCGTKVQPSHLNGVKFAGRGNTTTRGSALAIMNPRTMLKPSAIATPTISDKEKGNTMVSEAEVMAAVTSSKNITGSPPMAKKLGAVSNMSTSNGPLTTGKAHSRLSLGPIRPALSFEHAATNSENIKRQAVTNCPLTPRSVTPKTRPFKSGEIVDLTSPKSTKYFQDSALKTSNVSATTAKLSPTPLVSLMDTDESDIETPSRVRVPRSSVGRPKAQIKHLDSGTLPSKVAGDECNLNIVHGVVTLNIASQCSEPFHQVGQFCKECGPCIHLKGRSTEQ